MACISPDDESDEELDREPLDRLQLELKKNEVGITTPALHQGWVEEMKFVHYKCPPNLAAGQSKEELKTLQDEWLDRVTYIIEDLKWFLLLPHHRFWSQIVYDPQSRHFFDSFLFHAPRYYDPPNNYLTDEMWAATDEIAGKIFLIHLRMGTFKESKSCHISPTLFGEIIYDNFLFDIPKLMDLCVLYHMGDITYLKKIIFNIFNCQPKYSEDLSSTVPSIFNALENVETNLGLESAKTDGNGIKEMSLAQFQDVFRFLVDITVTLSAFLCVYEPACNIFQNHGLGSKIGSFYDVVIPALLLEMKTRLQRHEEEVQELRPLLKLIRSSCLKIFRSIIVNCYLEPLFEASDNEVKQTDCIDGFLELMTSVLSETSFVRDYGRKYAIEEDLDIIAQSRAILDSTRIEYLVQGIELILGDTKTENVTENSTEPKKANTNSTVFAEQFSDVFAEGACVSPSVVGIELESLITQVKDLLPDLGDGFIEACLNYYNFKTEDVIHILLEETLPPTLQQLDRKMTRKTAKENASKVKETVEYEKITHPTNEKCTEQQFEEDFPWDDMDASQIYLGKRGPKHRNIKDFLDDKSEMEEIKRRCQNLDIQEDDGDYNDEYDDTYDEHAVGAMELEKIRDEIQFGRPFVIPRVLNSGKREKVVDNFEEPEEEEEKLRDCFVPNPEKLREAHERRRQEKYERQHKSKNNNPGNRDRDVVGKPKGQGQTAQVQHNRGYKDRNKSSHANHNRRAASDRKRSGGMMPF